MAAWLNKLRHDRVLEDVAFEAPAAKHGEDLGDIVLKLRRQVLDLKHEAEQVAAASLPPAELKKAIRENLRRLKQEAAPQIDWQTGQIRQGPAHNLLGLLAWATPAVTGPHSTG